MIILVIIIPLLEKWNTTNTYIILQMVWFNLWMFITLKRIQIAKGTRSMKACYIQKILWFYISVFSQWFDHASIIPQFLSEFGIKMYIVDTKKCFFYRMQWFCNPVWFLIKRDCYSWKYTRQQGKFCRGSSRTSMQGGWGCRKNSWMSRWILFFNNMVQEENFLSGLCRPKPLATTSAEILHARKTSLH